MAAASLPALHSTPEPPPGLAHLQPAAAPVPPAATASSLAAINPAARLATVPAAVLGVVLLVIVFGIRFLLTRASLDLTRRIATGEPVDQGEADLFGALSFVYPFLGVIAIGGLGFWASRVVSNIPLLGGGWPRFTPGQAFIEHVIPGWNVLRTPAVYREMQSRLSSTERSNDVLILTWVLVNIAAIVIVRPIGSTLASFASTTEDVLRAFSIANYLSIGLQAIAIVLIALIVVDIESVQAQRVRTLGTKAASVAKSAKGATATATAASTEARKSLAARPLTALGGRRIGADELPATRAPKQARLETPKGPGEAAGPNTPTTG